MNQPEWECVAQLGDVNPLDHGGFWVFQDKAGNQTAEAELLVCPDSDSDARDNLWMAYRFSLERCTYQNEILSDNEFHPSHPAWFADTIEGVASFADYPEIIDDLCSEDPIKRATAYRAIGDYHGFENLDSYPLELRKRETKKRYSDKKYKAVNNV